MRRCATPANGPASNHFLQHLVAFNVWKLQVRRKGSPTTEYQLQTFDQPVLAPAVSALDNIRLYIPFHGHLLHNVSVLFRSSSSRLVS